MSTPSDKPHLILRQWRGAWWRSWSDQPQYWRGPFISDRAAAGQIGTTWVGQGREPVRVLLERADGTAEWDVLS